MDNENNIIHDALMQYCDELKNKSSKYILNPEKYGAIKTVMKSFAKLLASEFVEYTINISQDNIFPEEINIHLVLDTEAFSFTKKTKPLFENIVSNINGMTITSRIDKKLNIFTGIDDSFIEVSI